jgi:hypothetical protein
MPMKKVKKKTGKPLSRQVRSKAYLAPMGGAGPHRDRKNEYRRNRKQTNDQAKSSAEGDFFVFFRQIIFLYLLISTSIINY